ncbi:hypothetical protein EW146_g8746 [Bondarzewia mesenterica]|uniref:Uncharacterized protein n=1 Tax=Bondarzewia mesenterica TaxID=1095465 RepID=A0A4S4LDK8_9AGAM|nr:hypothetical protein EW146_g8746 [Bondarzewia mesenterica]
MSRSLRPCLKLGADQLSSSMGPSPFPFASCSTVQSPRVHFPPSPSLTSTHLTHSSKQYDRAPIVVAPNVCALPNRNERTYMPPSEPKRPAKPRASHYSHAQAVKGSYFHPRAFEACEREPSNVPVPAFDSPPPLVPDISSSESDESDTFLMTPPNPQLLPPMPFQLTNMSHAPMVYPREDRGSPMLFLPHPPSPKQERQRERERKRSPSRTRGQRHVKRSEFAAPELDGCLGGF